MRHRLKHKESAQDFDATAPFWVYVKTHKRFIVRDSLVAIEGQGRVNDDLNISDQYNKEVRVPRYGPDGLNPPTSRKLTRSMRSLECVNSSAGGVTNADSLSPGMESPEKLFQNVGDAADNSPLASPVLEQAKISYGTSAVTLPPFQSRPYLPLSLHLKSAFYSSPTQTLKFNPYLTIGSAANHWGESSSSKRLLKSSESWSRRQRALHGHGPTEPEQSDVMQAAFMLPRPALARTLERLDLLITVAHCSRCHDHISLRHDCAWYKKRAGEVLLLLGSVTVDYNPEARVGISRLKRCSFDVRKEERHIAALAPAVVRQTKLSELQRTLSTKKLEEQQRREQRHFELTPVSRSALSLHDEAADRSPSRRGKKECAISSLPSQPLDEDDENSEALNYSKASSLAVGSTEGKQTITSRLLRASIPLGAFEVQVSFRRADGTIVSKLLHSKLSTRAWPNGRALSSALDDFLSTHVSTLSHSTHPDGDAAGVKKSSNSENPTEDVTHSHDGAVGHDSKSDNGDGVEGDEKTYTIEAISNKPDGSGSRRRPSREETVPKVSKSMMCNSKPYCAYPETCPRGCRDKTSQVIVSLEQLEDGATQSRPIEKPHRSAGISPPVVLSAPKSKPAGSSLTWVLDQSDEVPLHDFAVGDVVDVLLVAPLSLSPRRRQLRGTGTKEKLGSTAPPIHSASVIQFSAEHCAIAASTISPVTTTRPRSQVRPHRDRSNSPSACSPRSLSLVHAAGTEPWRPASAGRGSSPPTLIKDEIRTRVPTTDKSKPKPKPKLKPKPNFELWYRQGFLRGSITSTHRDGTYDIAYWPTNSLGRYEPVLSTHSQSHGKMAVEGYIEVGVSPQFVRGLQGTSVLTLSPDHQNSLGPRLGSDTSPKSFQLCLTDEQLKKTARPWAPRHSTMMDDEGEGEGADDAETESDMEISVDDEFTREDVEAETDSQQNGDFIDCPSPEVEQFAYRHVLSL